MIIIKVIFAFLILFWQSNDSLVDPKIDEEVLLRTLRIIESSDGTDIGPRFEPKFLVRYGENGNMPYLRKEFGDEAAASSYGDYQILLTVAWQYHFQLSPDELAEPGNNEMVARFLVEKYMDQYGHGTSSLWKIFKRWNGGSEYASKAVEKYHELLESR